MSTFLRQVFSNFVRRATSDLTRQIEDAKILAAIAIIEQRQKDQIHSNLAEVEFKTFSQFGDDGIIQYLVQHVPAGGMRFVEIGVEDYREANTRLLLLKDNWSGLAVDSNPDHVRSIRRQHLYWRHDLVAVQSFVTAENVNATIEAAGFKGDVDLLSIDIDGNDYWVWKAIQVINPNIVVIEYNSMFGRDLSVTVPYDPNFQRFSAHHTGLYWGASLRALVRLGSEKGYVFVGCNSAGNNAYFVRDSALNGLTPHSVETGYVESKFRDSRDSRGNLTFLRGRQRLEAIQGLPVLDLDSGRTVPLFVETKP